MSNGFTTSASLRYGKNGASVGVHFMSKGNNDEISSLRVALSVQEALFLIDSLNAVIEELETGKRVPSYSGNAFAKMAALGIEWRKEAE